MKELGCGGCHAGVAHDESVREKAPDLSFAGERYRPEYLFDYLQNFSRVRKHIGAARMPDFRFSPDEALALALFLEQQKTESQDAIAIASMLGAADANPVGVGEPKALIRSSGCLACHQLHGEGLATAVELADISPRLQPGWFGKYAAAPSAYGIPIAVMPSFFFQKNSGGEFEQITQSAPQKIAAISNYLFSLNHDQIQSQRAKFAAARKEFPYATAEIGEKIFISQNCTACHENRNLASQGLTQAPDLSVENVRVQKEWLLNYLKKPEQLRPFGFIPGMRNRMPDFQLTQAEIDAIADDLSNQSGARSSVSGLEQEPLSAFRMIKARTLLEEKLSCLGCHQLGEKGGRIGPNLSSLNRRLQPQFVNQIIREPQVILGHRDMPQIPMPEKTRALIVNYLLQQSEKIMPFQMPSLVRQPPILMSDNKSTATNYRRYCASCHGLDGRGDGFNAPFLPKPATKHADGEYMKKRPDDTLFDGIYVGGYILNKSHFMPPWGKTLTTEEIQNLVAHMRALCQCEQPGWAGDGTENH